MSLKVEPGTFPNLKISSSFQELAKTAGHLNAESDKLTKTIDSIDTALRAMNIGVSAWVEFAKWTGENDEHGGYEVGYDNVYGGWGLSLRRVCFDDSCPLDDPSFKGWLYNAAPRHLRTQAVGHIPKLIEKLNSEASRIAREISEGNREADEIAKALEMAASMERIKVHGLALNPEKKEAK
jgi:hypothetical protein